MKLWGGRFRQQENRMMEEFNSSFPFDCRLYKEDITGSMAHVQMLGKCGIIPEKDAELIHQTLGEILEDIENGRLEVSGKSEDAEDIHTFVEGELIHRIGDVGKKLHTGRSRNDQVALDMRLYARSTAEIMIGKVSTLRETMLRKGRENNCLMPGYTHLQRAQVITFPYWTKAYASMLERDQKRLENALDLLNECPLGSAALAGTTHAIDRRMTADLMGFKRPVENFIDGVSDRDYLLELLSDLSIIMVHLSRLCEELILWSSQEFRFIELDDAYSTGSSIMPQKKNPDSCELVRGKAGRVFGDLTGLLTVMKGLPLAYDKDMQEDKEGFFDAVDTVEACLDIMNGVVATMKVNKNVMEQSVKKGFLNATEVADYLVDHGVPFRDAHAIVGRIVIECEDRGCAIEDLTLDELKKFDPCFDETIYDFLDYHHILTKGIKKEMLEK